MTEQKDFIKIFSMLLAVLLLCSTAFAEVIVVTPGTTNSNPPDSNTPTTSVVSCPAGYDCIKADDYSEFIAGLKDFTAEIGERTEFINAVFDRFDKKIQLDEETISNLVTITNNAQDRETQLQERYDELEASKNAYENLTEVKLKTLEIQVAELKATQLWQFITVFIMALFLAELVNRARRHKEFLWRKFQEIIPFKIG